MNQIPLNKAWPILIAVGFILLAQGTWLFLDARKRGGKAWFWGLWGMVQFPWPTVTYFALQWWKKRKLNLANESTEE